jgi:hypothetical protein
MDRVAAEQLLVADLPQYSLAPAARQSIACRLGEDLPMNSEPASRANFISSDLPKLVLQIRGTYFAASRIANAYSRWLKPCRDEFGLGRRSFSRLDPLGDEMRPFQFEQHVALRMRARFS